MSWLLILKTKIKQQIQQRRVQFSSASLQGGYCYILASPGTVGLLVGREEAIMGPSQWLLRDLTVPAFLFSSIAPSPGNSLGTSIPCLTLEDFQSSEWRDGRRVGENWFPALTLVIVLQTLSIWIFLDVVVFNDENLRDTERDTFFKHSWVHYLSVKRPFDLQKF